MYNLWKEKKYILDNVSFISLFKDAKNVHLQMLQPHQMDLQTFQQQQHLIQVMQQQQQQQVLQNQQRSLSLHESQVWQ